MAIGKRPTAISLPAASERRDARSAINTTQAVRRSVVMATTTRHRASRRDAMTISPHGFAHLTACGKQTLALVCYKASHTSGVQRGRQGKATSHWLPKGAALHNPACNVARRRCSFANVMTMRVFPPPRRHAQKMTHKLCRKRKTACKITSSNAHLPSFTAACIIRSWP